MRFRLVEIDREEAVHGLQTKDDREVDPAVPDVDSGRTVRGVQPVDDPRDPVTSP
jgi:hypothetical protein